VQSGSEYQKSTDAGVFIDLNVSSTGGSARPVTVRVEEPRFLNTLRRANHLPLLDQDARAAAAFVAAIRAVDANPDFFASLEPLRLDLGYDEFDETKTAAWIGDQALRRYIARRLYLTWEHGSFDSYLSFGSTDQSLTGGGPDSFLRNLQLLEQEGHLELSRTMGTGFSSFQARPTALLVREVERYGAARGDVESEADFTARLAVQDALLPERASILAERRRYELAQTAEDVASVFRSVMPVLEGLVRRLLRAHGSKKEHGTLGPMIGELRERGIGTRGLWSQLNAVLTNGRDISLHGEELPIAVLRMVTESCFELFPQLGLLFPNPPA
jgi:hypothetical protein